jgi:lipopolysaccharide transport system ATP-binding protein
MNTMVKVENLSKEYRLGVIGNGSLWKDIQSWNAKLQGKPDPWTRINEESRIGRRDRFWALKDVSFEVEQGERLGIIGRNGAGKSTLLKILSQITTPTEGTVKMRGRVGSLLEVGTGFHPDLTGRENVYLNGAILGMKKEEIDRNFDEIVAFSEIEPEFIDTPVKRYSSGMYVRLAFAVAAYLNSEILIADEVLAVGDIKFQEKCLGKMKEVSENEGRTILFVSHNLGAVKQLCPTAILLEHGELLAKGEIAEVIDRYQSIL